MKTFRVSLLIVFALVLTVTSVLAQSKPVKSSSRAAAIVSLAAPAQIKQAGEQFDVIVNVDMMRKGVGLGGYVVRLKYDTEVLELANVASGTFGVEPAYSLNSNQTGELILSGAKAGQGNIRSSTSIARLTFRAKKTGTTFISLDDSDSQRKNSLASQISDGGVMNLEGEYRDTALVIGTKAGGVNGRSPRTPSRVKSGGQ